MVHLDLRPVKTFNNFRKIWNGSNGILKGLGETDSWQKPEVENLVALSLKVTNVLYDEIIKAFLSIYR
jgi:hypothetical protein